MKKIMYFIIGLFIVSGLNACSGNDEKVASQTDSLISDIQTDAINIKALNEENSALEDFSKRIIGTWDYGHEPLTYEFKEDKTYNLIEVHGETAEDLVILETGKWFIKNEFITFSFEGKDIKQKLNFKDEYVYFGELPSSFPDEEGIENIEEYLENFGYKKR